MNTTTKAGSCTPVNNKQHKYEVSVYTAKLLDKLTAVDELCFSICDVMYKIHGEAEGAKKATGCVDICVNLKEWIYDQIKEQIGEALKDPDNCADNCTII